MSTDWYSDFVNSGIGKSLAGTVGLPPVPRLRRWEPGQPLLSGPALLGTATPAVRVARRSLEGLVRSAGKEARYGATVNLVHVAGGAENDVESTLRFFLSSR